MDTSKTCYSQSNSAIKKQSKSTSKKGWEHVIKKYQACDSDKHREKIQKNVIESIRNCGYNIVEPGGFSKKYNSVPYHLFFSKINLSEETHDQQNSITFPEILDRSLGKIVNSLHLNFIVDITWLCFQYVLAGQHTNMMILYGDRADKAEFGDTITAIQVEKPSDFGCHHSKITILQYSDGGIRVIVSTANLFVKDWENKTQGLWISPHLPPLSKSAHPSEGESPTNFKKDLGRYLSRYKNPLLKQWIEVVMKTNFLDVDVFLVASVPGEYTYFNTTLWGHRKLSLILSHHATLPANASKWPLVAQSSSIGSFGPDYESWLSNIVFSMSRETRKGSRRLPEFQFIYPSLENYKRSYDYMISTPCLSYSSDMHSKQKWIESYLYQWKAEETGRDLAMPHIKSYTRISPDLKSIPWFMLTSANLSKAAWGVKRRNRYCITNYEAGVVFLPKFITGTTTFPIKDGKVPAVPIFPILHDLPLCRYNKLDTPLITRKSIHGWHWLRSTNTD